MKNKITYITTTLLIIVMTICFTVAYYMDYKSTVNVFTTGNIKISLTEPKYNMQDNITARAYISPNEIVTKDPTITNTGISDAYVFFEFTMPRTNRNLIDDNGQKILNDYVDAFNFKEKDSWVQVEKKIVHFPEGEYCRYVYAYSSGDASSGKMIALKKGQSTPTVFKEDMLIHKNFIEPEIPIVYDFNIRAYGIQATKFLNSDKLEKHSPLFIWERVVNQIKMRGVK